MCKPAILDRPCCMPTVAPREFPDVTNSEYPTNVVASKSPFVRYVSWFPVCTRSTPQTRGGFGRGVTIIRDGKVWLVPLSKSKAKRSPSQVSLARSTDAARTSAEASRPHRCRPDAIPLRLRSVTSPYLPHIQPTVHRMSRFEVSLAMAYIYLYTHRTLAATERGTYAQIVAAPTTRRYPRAVPPVTPKPLSPFNRARQPWATYQQANCCNGGLCRSDHILSPSVNLSDRMDIEARR